MGKRILLVDDEPDIVSLYKKILEKAKYNVTTASSGDEALKIIESDTFDLIILDIMMPGLDGWETAKKIKSIPGFANVPIVMLTVKYQIEDKVKSIEKVGAARHITKPVDGPKLIETIQTLLGEI
jgi:CheY-like chemotaxis protein